ELEKEINFDGKKLRRIEVDPTTQEVTGFTDKRVEIKGRPTWIGGGPERGFYPIIEVASIRELSS
ncbi:hypothetical protein HYV43_05385, partial [Candidatus Micrarchaeota archaeon]|nr:hypothetical protein [Candidatus Micrarchaeota archaeon]